MTTEDFDRRFSNIRDEALPFPAEGCTAERHIALFEIAREDVSLAKLAEAHWDALAILREAGREPEPGALYGVWASEVPGKPLEWSDGLLSGTKSFCSGAGLIDRALVTVGSGTVGSGNVGSGNVGSDGGRLLDVDLRSGLVESDTSAWQVNAFRRTRTGAVTFHHLAVSAEAVVGESGFYLQRPGFWHGACGPAACWAGGAAGLLAFAHNSRREDAHTLAHLAAMHTGVWAMQALLRVAGDEIDRAPDDATAAHTRALKLRHAVDLLASDTLRHFARAYGPHPLAMDAEMSRRFQETEIFLRQSHAERDLEALAESLRRERTS